MNRGTLVLAAGALALGTAVPALIGGYIWGAADMEMITRLPTCTVEDQKLAEFHRSQEIDAENEKKIDLKMKVLSDVGYLESTKKELQFEISQLDSERLRLAVEVERLHKHMTTMMENL